MNLAARDIRLVSVLARTRHFGRAAEELGMGQPQLSLRLARLEEAFGVRLFERRPSARITPAGQLVLDAGERALASFRSGLERARAAERGESGRVELGFASTAMLSPLPGLIQAFREAHPGVEVRLRDMHSGAQWDALLSGAIDVAVTREARDDPRIASALFERQRLAAIVGAAHPMAGDGPLPLRALADEPFVLFAAPVAPSLHAQIVGLCAAAGFRPRIVDEADEWYTVLTFVAAGMGVTIAPEPLARLAWPGLSFRALAEPDASTSIRLCWNPARASPAARLLAAWLERHGCGAAA